MASAGKVNGTVTKAERTPPAPRSRHSGAPDRLAALSTRDRPRFGLDEKLKMPWPAGLRPVRNDDHAVGVTAGIVERSDPYAPSRTSRPSVGSFPSASRRSTRSRSAPSRPRTSTRMAAILSTGLCRARRYHARRADRREAHDRGPGLRAAGDRLRRHARRAARAAGPHGAGSVGEARVLRPADHRAGVVVHDVVARPRHARVLRLPKPQGPLLRR